MNYQVIYSRRFTKALKRVKNYPQFKEEKLFLALSLLASWTPLPTEFHDHALSGEMSLSREFHITSDILVVYQIHEEILEILVINMGTHSQLFG